MNKLIKKHTITALFSSLLIGSFYPATQTLAENKEPILIEIKDTDIGTEAFEKLKEFGTGGHANLGTILGSGQNMTTNPGVGLGIGSGGNGYRPTVTITVWTDKPFDAAAGLQTIKQHLNVTANPVTTNGDCAIACDGTTQTSSKQPEASQTASETSTATQTGTSTQTTPTTAEVKSQPAEVKSQPAEVKSQPVAETTSKPAVTTITTSTTVETITTSKAVETVTVETVNVTPQVENVTSESGFVLEPGDAPFRLAITAERIGDYNITPNV